VTAINDYTDDIMFRFIEKYKYFIAYVVSLLLCLLVWLGFIMHFIMHFAVFVLLRCWLGATGRASGL